jgi:hypothetical protein
MDLQSKVMNEQHPHFVIDPGAPLDAQRELRKLESAINERPILLGEALLYFATKDSIAVKDQSTESRLRATDAFSLDEEVIAAEAIWVLYENNQRYKVLEFDSDTEEIIEGYPDIREAVKLLRDSRTTHKEKLQKRIRMQRMFLYIGRVLARQDSHQALPNQSKVS